MNYLAHLYLSGNDESLLFGNFIADHVKGSFLNQYEPSVQKGIRLHRLIDSYTDQHPVVLLGKIRLRPYVGKYAPVALDILYDHFLAVNWADHHPVSLSLFTTTVFELLDKKLLQMPEKTQLMYGYMRRDNWLVGYAEVKGIERALIGLSRRTKFESNLGNAAVALTDHYVIFEKEFTVFFEELKLYIAQVEIP